MRRSMVAMLALTSALSTTLAAQTAWSFGVAGTLGGGWQVETVDLGYMAGIHVGPMRWVTVGTRLGMFVDQSQIVGGSQGFVGAVVLQGRTGVIRLADVGNETNPGSLGLDVTLEAVGYAGVRSPLPQGSPWGAFSVLPGIRFGDPESVRYGLVVGPTVFLGEATTVHPFLALRFDLPISHRRSHS